MKQIAMLAASVLVVVLAAGSPAHAADTSQGYGEARAFLASFGATTATQDRLIKDLQSGGKWDSLSSESEPVSTVQKTRTDGLYTINTYRDGSISVLRIEALGTHPKDASTKGVSGCSVSGKVRSNCLVDMWVGLVRMSFRASYNLGTNKVTRVYGPSYSVGGSCSTSLISLGRPAYNIGRMDIQAQACVVGYSTTFFLQLKVSGGKTRVTWDG